jgi:hypothetical protein
MATPTVWISVTSNVATTDGDHPGEHWERAGVIDTSAQAEFFTYIQVHIGGRPATRGRAEFYLNGDPGSGWVRQAKADPTGQVPFWILIDPYGDASINYDGGSVRYLVGTEKATTVRSLALREPEAHPGSVVKPVVIAVRMGGPDGNVFTPLRTAERH